MSEDKKNSKIEIILRILPFVSVISLNIFIEVSHYNMEIIYPFVLMIGTILILNLVISLAMNIKDYFIYGISGVAILGIILVFLVPSIGQFYIKNVIAGLYLGLFIVAFFPPLFKIKPFTISISEKDYPEAIVKSKEFIRINLIINYIWAGLFALAMLLSIVQYSDNTILNIILSMVLPNLVLVLIGIPVSIKLPSILAQKGTGNQMHFETVKELFEMMPYGLNKELAQGVDSVIQFYLTGAEPTEGYLIIKNSECSFKNGVHPNPKTIIKADSKLWLGISNNEISGSKAYINKEYEVQGDMTILLNLEKLFSPTEKNEEKFELKKTDFNYNKTFEPGSIKKIVIFDGGPRSIKFSKTSFMVNNFIEGAKEAGANVEYFKLKDLDIHDCSGCYNCWTKTPGECIYKDDMTMLRKKSHEADLIVFASPLYVFNVTGILKTFLERLVPNLEPYILIDKRGFTKHPNRYPELGEKGFVVFSASGFPSVENNFDGLRGMFKMLDLHNENLHMVGEFYLTAAETIVQPIYRDRKNMIQDICKKAGKQIVTEGKIDVKLMQKVIDPGFSLKQFQEESNYFWESLDGKTAYQEEAPKITSPISNIKK